MQNSGSTKEALWGKGHLTLLGKVGEESERRPQWSLEGCTEFSRQRGQGWDFRQRKHLRKEEAVTKP